jgi:Carboxypeptidase regulatory-like domain
MKLLLTFLCVLIGSAFAFQTAPRADSSGLSVRGQVLQQPGGQPIRKANVHLMGASRYAATADGDGKFTINDVSPGIYRISVEHPGFVEILSAKTSLVSVEVGKDSGNLVLLMQPAGVITGKILDRDGDPMKGVRVTAVGANSLKQKRPNSGGSETTNDLGEFRIPDLAAGAYEVNATSPAEPPQTDEAKKAGGHIVYATTYYPGTVEKAQAAPVEVQPGNETPISFGLLTTKVYRATGRIVGMPSGGMAQLLLTAQKNDVFLNDAKIGENGEFVLDKLLPGSYQAHLILFTFAGAKPGGKVVRLTPPIEVDHDLAGLTLQVEPTVSVHGKFRMDKGSNPSWSQINVTLFPLGENTGEGFSAPFDPPVASGVNSDGSFELKDVPGGLHQLVVGSSSNALRDYFTKAVEINGHDVIDSGFEVQPGTVLDVIVSASGAKVEGIVRDKKGDPVPNATVLTIPAVEHRLRPDLYEQEKTGVNGHFTLPGLSPGEYSVLAFEDLEEDFHQPDFLKSYEEMSERVHLEEGDTKSLVLKLIPVNPE